MKYRFNKKNILGLVFVLFLLFPFYFTLSPVHAAIGINEQISYIAILKNSSGNVLADGNIDIVFKIYDAPTGGTLKWTGNYTTANGNPAQIQNGVVTVALGSGAGNAFPSGFFQEDTLYAGISVGGDAEMSPRIRVTSAAQAINTRYFNGLDASQLVRADIPATMVGVSVTGSATIGQGLYIPSYIPADTGNALYSNAGSLYFNGVPVTSGACATCLLNGGNSPSSALQIGTLNAQSLQLVTNGTTTPRVTILSSGHVGIGTVTPTYALTVAGTIAPSDHLAYDLGSPTNYWRALYVGSLTASGTLTATAISVPSSGSTFTVSGGAMFGSQTTNGTITTTGITVSNFANFNGPVSFNNYAPTFIQGIQIADGSAANPGLVFINDTDTGIFRPGSNIFALSTGGIEHLRLSGNGRLSVGTSAGNGLFEVGTNAVAGAAGILYSGNWYAGGSADSTKPALLVEPVGAVSNNWVVGGTGIGVNSAPGFTGNLLDLQVNGMRKFSIDYTGKVILDPSLPFTINTGGADRLSVSNTGTFSFPSNNPSIVINGTDTLSINDTTGKNLAEIKSLGKAFGGAIESGAVISRNSFFGEEFSQERAQISTTTDRNWGNTSAWGTDEINGIGNCTWNINDDTANGISRMRNMSAGDGCLTYLSQAVNDPFLAFSAANLPVVLAKVRPSVVSATDQYFVGLGNAVDATGTDPANGVYFRNNNATWEGVAASGGSITSVSCGVSVSLTQFALLKLEVLTGTTERFYVDNDVSDGISYTFCGTVSSNVPTGGLTAMIKMTTTTTPADLDVDFFRVWEDDNVTVAENASMLQQKPLDLKTQSNIALGYDVENAYPVGTVMALVSEHGKKKVVPAQKSGTVLGVVTEDMGLTLGQQGKDRLPLASFGRALVRVMPSSDIAPGDLITVSSTPGVADKATVSGFVLGRALQAVSVGEEKAILVVLQISWQNVNNQFVIEPFAQAENTLQSADGAGGNEFVSGFLINQKSSGNLLQLQQNGMDRFVIDNAGSVSIATEITDSKKHVLKVENKKQVLFKITAGGVAHIHTKILVGKDTAGVVRVPPGQNTAHVSFTTPYESTPIVILTPVGNLRVKYTVSNPLPDGFDVQIEDSRGEEIILNWLVIGEIKAEE